MRHYLFVNKYNSTLYKVDGSNITRESFKYGDEYLDIINNTAYLDIEKESYVLMPKISPFKIGYDHYFSLDNVFGYTADSIYFLFDFLNQVFDLIEDLKNIAIVFSVGAIGNNIDMQKFKLGLERIFDKYKIEVLVKDCLFMGSVTFLSMVKEKSISLVSGFNILSSIIENNSITRGSETIWVDKKNVIENIKYHQDFSGLKDDKEFQRVFDLTIDSRLNYGNPDLYYEIRDHSYKINTEILDDYINKLKDNIKSLVKKDVFYLFDISFPLIYDEFVKNLEIDIDKRDEMIEYFKYVIEYSELLLKYNTSYMRIMNKKKRSYSLTDGYLEYDIEPLINKKRSFVTSLFNTKYIKREK